MAETPWENLTTQAYELALSMFGDYDSADEMRDGLIAYCAEQPHAWKPDGPAIEIIDEALGEHDIRLDRALGVALAHAHECADEGGDPVFSKFADLIVREMLLSETISCGEELFENPKWTPYGGPL